MYWLLNDSHGRGNGGPSLGQLLCMCVMAQVVAFPHVAQAQATQPHVVDQARTPASQAERELDRYRKEQQSEEVARELERARDMQRRQDAPVERADEEDDGVSSGKADVHSVVLRGDPVGQANLADTFRKYQRSGITTADILDLLREVNGYYYRAGYPTTFVTVNPQGLADGELTLDVRWGRIRGWRLADGGKPSRSQRVRLATAFPGSEGKILNVHDIDQAVENLGGIAAGVRIDIVATEEAGYSYLVVAMGARVGMHLSAGLNNSGQGDRDSGLYKENAVVGLTGLLSLNESISLTRSEGLYEDDHAGDSDSRVGVAMSIPYGRLALDSSYNASTYRKVLPGMYGSYTSRGKVEDASLKLTGVTRRTARGKTSTYLRLGTKETENSIDDIRLLTSSVDQGEVSGGVSYAGQLGAGFAYAEIAAAKGVGFLGASTRKEMLPCDCDPRYLKVNVSGNYTRDLNLGDIKANYNGAIGAQYSDYRLPYSAQLTIGDEYTVRGFKASSASGDQGVFVSNTLSLPDALSRIVPRLRISPFIGLDGGLVHSKGGGTSQLIGTAAGLRFQAERWGGASLTYGQPLKSDGLPRDPAVYFQINLRASL